MNKIAAIIGCASCWREDLDRFKSICSDFDVFAIGLDCPYEDEIKYFVTYHVEDIQKYKEKRKLKGLNLDYQVISHTNDFKKYCKERNKKIKWTEGVNVDVVYPYEPPSGSSSLLGTRAALIKLGYKKVVLAGCPLGIGNILNETKSYNVFKKGWTKLKPGLVDKVKSMSGWTKELLGEPTKEWIEE